MSRRAFLKGTAATAAAGALAGILAARQAPAAAQRTVELRFYDWKLAAPSNPSS